MDKADEAIDSALHDWASQGGFGVQMVKNALTDAGLAIVPVEPTEAMMAPVHKLKMLNSKEIFLCGEDVRNCGIWKAMLRAVQETGT